MKLIWGRAPWLRHGVRALPTPAAWACVVMQISNGLPLE